MNLITNELSGLFLLPISTTLSSGTWDVMNGLGFVFIPFIVLYVKSFFEARAQGMDEGSPAVLATKMVEKGFWGYIIVIAFVLTPYDSELRVEHSQFSCRNNPSIISNNLASAETASKDALNALGVRPNLSPPLFYGFVHQLSTGINEAAISQMSCEKGASAVEVANALDKMIPDTESLFRSVQNFDQKCFKVAQTKAQTALAANEEMRHSIDNKYGWTFHAPMFATNAGLINGVYEGSFIQDKNTARMTMEVPEVWFENTHKGQTMRCSVLAENLYNKIESDIRATPQFSENVESLLSFTSLMNPSVKEAEIIHDMVVRVYENSVTYTPPQGAGWKEADDDLGWSLGSLFNFAGVKFGTNFHDWSAPEEDFSVMNTVGSWMVTLGAIGTTISESAKSYAVALMLPIIVVIIQSVLLIALPILTVISGLSFKFLLNWTLLYFSVTLVPFWLNVGLQLETLLLSLSNYSDSLVGHAINIQQGTDMQMYLVSSTSATFVYLIPVIWVMLVQIVGNIAASSFMNAVSGAAIVGQTGADAVTSAAGKTGDALGNELGRYLKGKAPSRWDGVDIGGGGNGGMGGSSKINSPHREGISK